MAWVVRFVDKPDADRTVRFDLNAGEAGMPYVLVNVEGFDLGTAALTRSLVSSMLTEGELQTASARTNRTVSIPLEVRGDTWEFSTVMGALARELDRERNYLEWQPDGADEPMFFTCLRGETADVEIVDAGANIWAVTLELLCQPVAVGLKVSGGPTTVANDPATGQVLSLPDIRGDVATPLNVELASSAASGATTLLSAHTKPATPGVLLLQAETGTLGADTTVQANDTAMSGTGSNYVRTTFATATALQQRVSFPNLTVAFGEYKVLVRVRKSSAGAVYSLRRRLVTYGGDAFSGPTRTYNATSFATDVNWLDLGQVSFPAGHIPPGDTAGNIGELLVDVGRVSGTGSVDIDAVKLVPTRLPDAPPVNTSLTWRSAPTLSGTVLGFDGDTDEVYTYRTTGEVGVEKISRGGSLPMVYPGHDNHLVIMRSVGQRPGGSGLIRPDVLSWSSDVTWSYRPRYLYISGRN